MSADAHNCDTKRQLAVLGQSVRELREQRNLSAGLLAIRTGSTLQHIHELEAGEFDPDYEELIVLAEKGLGIRLSALVTYATRCESRSRSP
ncbi:MAG TPA: helix-turn-helix transcriptional regulator [Solirubrobacteraceae bacterium]|jgi:transcriptional regulator with XRE-family HTH domain|nr:helix-turn-helix transcriptional regulator [Solirubrobacteraceae bacterium]